MSEPKDQGDERRPRCVEDFSSGLPFKILPPEDSADENGAPDPDDEDLDAWIDALWADWVE